ncbi:hypothetical protein NKR23_g12018 [Pleurostoma richardsiae]|uniref:SMODS and SLOG-associating 2TM effector domain-containing protein n=1 Tax=Pleurostoma richardsiae TaxID=41990 RepID=A0AA38VJ71_9PEZI|nr:hypothetical protein NKR23_g12018 [Pleurostoma richardsiae]
MLGITTSPSLGFSAHGLHGTRPASNIGLYARVVQSEQKSKNSFKVFSAVINACYFLQIIVAAALTALGAANANNKAITAFGAINTVIAGFLTFLKGSGLPGRLKYFGSEWKKIREYIEQRERDFSRQGCTLNVHEVVNTIEQMYANTKREIEMNTPDSYNSIEGIMGKLKGLESTIGSFKSRIQEGVRDMDGLVHHIQDDEKRAESRMRDLGDEIKRGIEEQKPRFTREMSQTVDNAATEADQRVSQAENDLMAGQVKVLVDDMTIRKG